MQLSWRQFHDLQSLQRTTGVGLDLPGFVDLRRDAARYLTVSDQARGPAPSEPVGNLVFPVRVEEFLYQIGRQHVASGIQIDHLRFEIAHFPRDDSAESP